MQEQSSYSNTGETKGKDQVVVGSMFQKYSLSVLAAFLAEFVTYPLDLVKTRLQIQGEGVRKVVAYRGTVQTLVGVAREEGVLLLWQGCTPGMARHVIYSGVRMNLYDIMRTEYKSTVNRDLGLLDRVVLGMVAGGLGQWVASPADLIKVRMQMEGRRRLQGLPVRVGSIREALATAIKEGGVKSLWKGAVPNVQRAALVNIGDLTTYDQTKSMLVAGRGWSRDSMLTHGMSSVCAGLAAATLGTPADVIKARVMNQPVDELGRGKYYSGILDCLMKSIRTEGLMSLYKGFIPCWLRMAPWSMTFWLSFEKMRVLANIDSW